MSVTEKTYEMLWNCRFCGQRKNLGLSHRHCPGCGAPQDPNARYFPSDAEKVAVEDHPYVGADVHCPACRFANARNSRCCTNCGSPITGGQTVALRDAPPAALPLGAPAPIGGALGAVPAVKKPFPWRYLFVPLVFVVLAFIGCLYAVLKTRPAEFEVKGRSWERAIAVEQNVIERESTWCSSVPSGSRVIAKRRAQHGSEKIPNGETCTTKKRDQGNGTFKETRECVPKYKDKPIYDEECDYEVPRWRTVRTERARGSATDAPRWPDARVTTPGACVGCEREGKRIETYLLAIQESKTGSARECSVSEGTWSTFKVGDRCSGEVGAVFGNIDCNSLKKR